MEPVISIGILTRNAGEDFKHTLRALCAQRIAEPFEILVLDTASSDDTRVYAREAGARVEIISKDEFSFGYCRDRLFESARGSILVTLSQDAVPSGPDWLAWMTDPIREGRADIVQGGELKRSKTFYWDRVHEFYFTRDWRSFQKRYGDIGLSCVNLALSREACRIS